MYDTLLVPTDGSPAMETVLEHARDIAARREADVRVLYVVDDRAFLTMDEDVVPEVTDDLYAEGQGAVNEAASVLESAVPSVTTELRRGDPAEEIVASTDATDVDLVVMGTRGSDPGAALMGSTARTVVTRSPVPVHAVPVGERDRPADAGSD